MKLKRLMVLWYENDAGDRLEALPDDLLPPRPGFHFQHARFPREIHHRVLKLLPDGSCPTVAAMVSTWNVRLAAALARPTLLERLRQLVRYGRFAPTLPLDEAVSVSAAACEACLNVLLHRCGAGGDSGYREGSEEWRRAGTRCELCEDNPSPGRPRRAGTGAELVRAVP